MQYDNLKWDSNWCVHDKLQIVDNSDIGLQIKWEYVLQEKICFQKEGLDMDNTTLLKLSGVPTSKSRFRRARISQ